MNVFPTASKEELSGSAQIISRRRVVASAATTVEVSYTHAGSSLEQGQGVGLITPNGYSDWWSTPQVNDPFEWGYSTARTASGATLELAAWMPMAGSRGLWADIKEGKLDAGDEVIFVFGDMSGGSPGTRVQHTALADVLFMVAVGGKQFGNWKVLAENPVLDVLNRPPRSLWVKARTNAVVGKPVKVSVSAMDEDHNACTDYTGTVELFAGTAEAILPVSYAFGAGDAGAHDFEVIFETPGTYTVTACDRPTALVGESNPIIVTEEELDLKVWWGEIHGQTQISDGAGTLDQYYRYLRDVAAMDIGAVTNHDGAICYTTDADWAHTQEMARNYHEPGSLVTFLAYEWSAMPQYGHKNVYYLNDDEPIFRWTEEQSNDPEKLWKCLAGRKAMTIPHHPAAGFYPTDFDYHNAHFERLVEIYSYHGNSESARAPQQIFTGWRWAGGQVLDDFDPSGHWVVDALNRGYRLGLVGGSDGHQCQPGNETSTERFPEGKSGGYLAVLAPELTRESIWEAMWNRRVYATSGVRIHLDFTVNGHLMGSEFATSEPREISVQATGTGDIVRVVVFRNGQARFEEAVQDIRKPKEERRHCELHFVDTDPLEADVTYYYVRVEQSDGHVAWSSPVWVRKD